MSAAPLLAANALQRSFSVKAGLFQPRQTLHAVNGVDVAVNRGEVLGIVGESGCGAG
jgi:peptide/nickel transport system ATP-binding protein